MRDTLKRRAISVSSSAAPGARVAAHDLVGEMLAQFLGAGQLVGARDATSAPRYRLRLSIGERGDEFWQIVKTHALSRGSSITLTCAATIFHPSGNRTQVCI